MSYSDVFGGGSINPARRTYIPLTISGDVVLQWPIEQQIGGDEVAVDIIDLDATIPGLNVDYNDARQVSTGFTSLFNNVGANTATIRDSAGGTIISLAPGESWFIYLTDNSIAAGVWRTFQLGATVTVAVASALAGAGLKAITTTLNQTMPPTSTAITPINWTDSDRAQLTIWTGAAGVLNLPSPAAIGADWFAIIRNEGSGDLTVTPPSGTINSQATLGMAPLDSAMIVTDGTNFFTIGLGPQGAAFFDFVAIAVPGSGDFVLSGVQLNRISYRFTGALTGDRSIIVPTAVQQYWIDNRTTGAFSLFVKTAAQVTPVEVLQNNSNILYCDGVDVVNAESGAVTIPLPVAQGGTGAVTAPTARVNLGVPPITRLINTLALSGLANGGDLAADRDLELDVNNLTVELVIDTAADTFAFFDDSVAAMRKAPLNLITGVTVQDEGTPLVTLGTTLNFVGPGVVASGAGGTKTITISSVPASTVASSVLRGDGAGNWIEETDVRISATGQLNIRDGALFLSDAAGANGMQFRQLGGTGTVETLGISGGGTIQWGTRNRFAGVTNWVQKAAAFPVPIPLEAEIWLRDDTPNTLMYTRDDGKDVPLVEEGSFTVDFDLGFTGSNLVVLQYIRIGDLVHITMPNANLGTSNAINCGTGPDWLASLMPDSTRYGTGPVIDNAAAIVLAQLTLTSTGFLTFFAPNAANPPDYGNFWTAFGVKGVVGGWSWSYRITDS